MVLAIKPYLYKMSLDIKLHRKLKGYNPIYMEKVKGVQTHIYVLSI